MMYSEFLRIGGDKVKNISFTEYSEMVEPLYLYCDIGLPVGMVAHWLLIGY